LEAPSIVTISFHKFSHRKGFLSSIITISSHHIFPDKLQLNSNQLFLIFLDRKHYYMEAINIIISTINSIRCVIKTCADFFLSQNKWLITGSIFSRFTKQNAHHGRHSVFEPPHNVFRKKFHDTHWVPQENK
jgi:hypothetical protein